MPLGCFQGVAICTIRVSLYLLAVPAGGEDTVNPGFLPLTAVLVTPTGIEPVFQP